MLQQANQLLDQVTHPELNPAAEPGSVPETLAYECDESGCVLVMRSVDDLRPGTPLLPLSKLLSGSEWALGIARGARGKGEYPAVVSGPNWLIPLRATELSGFIEDLSRIHAVVNNLYRQGEWFDGSNGQPISSVKWEAGTVYMEARHEAGPQQPFFSLSFRVTTRSQRPVEASWPAHVVAEVLTALASEDLELDFAVSRQAATSRA